MIGIGGCGMSGIAAYLHEKGASVTGSDQVRSKRSEELQEKGIAIQEGHVPNYIKAAEYVVVSSAIKEENPEYQYALENKLTILRRAEMLAIIFNAFPKAIAAAGTHGKTTCSGFLSHIFTVAGENPSFVLGSELQNRQSNYHMSNSDVCIIEADESDGTFEYFYPTLGLISNIEMEHMNFFKTKERLLEYFLKFTNNIHEKSGSVFFNTDDELSNTIREKTPCNAITYALDSEAKYQAVDIKYSESGLQFTLIASGKNQGEISAALFGRHNVYNTLSVIAIALEYGLSLEDIKAACKTFQGTARRMQKIGQKENLTVYDDYGHHPTEVKTTLNGLKKSKKGKIMCIFQPHRYTRTQESIDLFKSAFSDADEVIILEIYAASESPIKGVDAEWLVSEIKKAGHQNICHKTKEDAVNYILENQKNWNYVVTMGAGDVTKLAYKIVEKL